MIRACLFGTYNASHPANRLLAEAFVAAGCDVSVCHEPLWERTRDKMTSFFAAPSLLRLGLAYVGAARRLRSAWRRSPMPELLITGFNGQLDALLGRRLGGVRTRHVFAPLVTLTETLVDDRGVYRRGGVAARLAAALDRLTLASADLVLLDTDAHRAWVAEHLSAAAPTATLYLGAEPMFAPVPPRARAAGEPLRVLFYGQYVPLHGTTVIVDAAAALGPGAGIELTMIGTGPERARAEALAGARGCTHLRFEDWVSYERLPDRLAACDVALGVFGTSAKAAMVIPTKVYQAAAVGRAIVTGDSPAVREIFIPGESVVTVRRGDAGALASALAALRDAPALAPRLGSAAARLVAETLGADRRGARLAAILATAFPELATRLPVPATAERSLAATGGARAPAVS